MKFLLVRLSALGDVVCTLPVAGHLKAAFPDCHITWVVDSRFRGVVDCCRHVDEVIAVKRGERPAIDGELDAALDMQGLLKSALIVRPAKAKHKLGYHWQREGAQFFSQRVLPDPSSFHIVDQYIDVARAACSVLGIAPRDLPTDFGLVPKDQSKIQGDYVIINPGAGWVTKRWPPASFARVAEWITEKGWKPVLIGGKADADHQAFDEVQKETTVELIKMTGETSVQELVALVAGAKAHVGGDTGSTHLAAALGIPAIGLYSITRPARSCPYGQLENCQYDPRGLAQIAPESVIAQLGQVLRP